MSWRLALSLVVLRAEVNARWPGRDRSSDGALGDAAHSARLSDHNPDDHGVVRAIDIDDNDVRPEDEGIGRVIAETIRARRDSRVKYLIYQGQMASSYPTGTVPAWEWRPYTGVNAHLKHLHVSVVPGAHADDVEPWGLLDRTSTPGTTTAIDQEDAMTPELATAFATLGAAISTLRTELAAVRVAVLATRASVGTLQRWRSVDVGSEVPGAVWQATEASPGWVWLTQEQAALIDPDGGADPSGDLPGWGSGSAPGVTDEQLRTISVLRGWPSPLPSDRAAAGLPPLVQGGGVPVKAPAPAAVVEGPRVESISITPGA